MKRMTKASPTSSRSSDHSRARVTFLDHGRAEDGLVSPTRHHPTRISPQQLSPRSHSLTSSHPPPLSPLPPTTTPSVLSALSALQSRCAELRLEKRLLLSQLDEAKEEGKRREEEAVHRGEEGVKRERQRLREVMEEEERMREQWGKERELWEVGLKRRESRVTEMKGKVQRWEVEFSRVKQQLADIHTKTQERDQQHATEVEALRRELDAVRGRGGQWERERGEMQQTVVKLVTDLKSLNEHCEGMERAQKDVRRVLGEAGGLMDQWADVRRRRRGKMDDDLLSTVRRQEEWIARLLHAARVDQRSRQHRRQRNEEKEDDSTDVEERPQRMSSHTSPRPSSAVRTRQGVKGLISQQGWAQSEKTGRRERSSAVNPPPQVSVFRSVAPPPPSALPRPHSATRPLSARLSLPRPSSSASTKSSTARSALLSRRRSSSHSRVVSPRSMRFTDASERATESRPRGGLEDRSEWRGQGSSASAKSHARGGRPQLPEEFLQRWQMDRSELLHDYKPMLTSLTS